VYVFELAGQDDAFAAYEASHAASDVRVLAPGLARARGVTDRVRHLAFTHRISNLIGRTGGDQLVECARAVLEAATFDREGAIAVRAVDVRGTAGIDTQRAERELGQALVDRGFTVDLDDPDHELRALFSENQDRNDSSDEPGICVLGWLTAETVRDFARRRPTDRPFFQPGSMDPMLARALVNVAGARGTATVLDPMCGTGGVLVEAGLVGADVVGLDAQAKMVQGTRQNLADALDGEWHILQGDAASLPVADGAVDAVVFDTPYGRQSKIEGQLDVLVRDALREARRVAPRCVVVGDRPWARPAGEAGWTIEASFERRVHRSLTRYVLVLRRE
jgi:tRNA (guanine10-N2)-dimethyltransferase